MFLYVYFFTTWHVLACYADLRCHSTVKKTCHNDAFYKERKKRVTMTRFYRT